MDTTYRDAHQSLLATRMRTRELMTCATYTSSVLSNMYALECWGGATFDTTLRFLKECPWERLRLLRKAIPNIPFSMLLRGANAVGYTSYPDNAVFKFCEISVREGMDVFRVFDSLNYMPNLTLGMDAVRKAGGIVETAICYSGDVSNPAKKKFTLDYYLRLTRDVVKAGTHVLCIKDMAGLLKPRAATMLINAIRKEFPDLPIHVHTHDTSGAGVAAMLACAEAGADAVDVACDSMSGTTSQPSMGAIIASVEGTELDTGIKLADSTTYSDFWEQARGLYAPFEATVTLKSGGADVYDHEIPGGQYTNLHFQAFSLGLSKEWPLIKKAYSAANRLLGDIVKVTPSSKVVGDLAQFMVQNKLSEDDVRARADSLSFPSSVVEYFEGLLGIPEGGFPEPIRTQVLKGRLDSVRLEGRPGDFLPPTDFEKTTSTLKQKYGVKELTDCDMISYVMYPKVMDEYMAFRQDYGDLTEIPTWAFFSGMKIGEKMQIQIAKGKMLNITYKAMGELNPIDGTREVFYELNGQPRSVFIRDTKSAAAKNIKTRTQANKADPGQVGAPMPGSIIDVKVEVGKAVKKGTVIAVMSAMKMETVVASQIDGTIKELAVVPGDMLSAGDLIAIIA
jgi:pyruvate carboxylase